MGALLLGACNPCDSLCEDIAERLDGCSTGGSYWSDLGARGAADWASQCRRDWDDASNDLNSRQIELALDVCRQSSTDLQALTCDEVRSLYAPLGP